MKILRQQQGAVLVISLIILLVLTLIGISGARGVLMSERITFASRDAKIALEVAESMARQGERHIEGLSDLSGFAQTGWLRTEGDGPVDLFAADTWKNANSMARDVPMKGADGNQLKGRMYIELAGLISDDTTVTDVDLSAGPKGDAGSKKQVFKVVSYGQGIGGTERIIVTLYAKEI